MNSGQFIACGPAHSSNDRFLPSTAAHREKLAVIFREPVSAASGTLSPFSVSGIYDTERTPLAGTKILFPAQTAMIWYLAPRENCPQRPPLCSGALENLRRRQPNVTIPAIHFFSRAHCFAHPAPEGTRRSVHAGFEKSQTSSCPLDRISRRKVTAGDLRRISSRASRNNIAGISTAP